MNRLRWVGIALGMLLSRPVAAQLPRDTGLVGMYRRAPFQLGLSVDGRYRVGSGSVAVVEGRFHTSRDTVSIVDEGGPLACPSEVTGHYVARLSRDSLVFQKVDDPCVGRRGGLADGAWERELSDAPVALTHVAVIDGTGAPARPDMTLVLAGGRIADLFRSGAKPVPAGVQVLDLTGRWVIPGLIDTHVHLATDPSKEDRRTAVERRLRNALHGGVTAVRDMAGDGRALADLARAALVGDIESPAIYYAALMAGPEFFTDPRVLASARGVTPGTAPWAQAVSAGTEWPIAVAEAKGTGASAIKVYAAAPPAVLRPLVAEAHRQGMRVWAHATLLPPRPSDVVGAGVDVVSHASLLVWEVAPVLPGFDGRRSGDYAGISPRDPRLLALFERMKERGTLLDATLYVVQQRSEAARWSEAATRAAWEAGVPITAGTDDIGGDGVGALPNLHEELRLLVEAGLPPLAALTAATANAARALGVDSTRGTIAVGKAADLVVLTADPSVDIRHTRDILFVLRNGKRFDPLEGGGVTAGH